MQHMSFVALAIRSGRMNAITTNNRFNPRLREPEPVAPGERHHGIDLGQWNLVTDAVIAAVAFESQENRFTQASELDAVAQPELITRAEARARIAQRDQAAVEDDQLGPIAQPSRCVGRAGDIAHDSPRSEQSVVTHRP